MVSLNKRHTNKIPQIVENRDKGAYGYSIVTCGSVTLNFMKRFAIMLIIKSYFLIYILHLNKEFYIPY